MSPATARAVSPATARAVSTRRGFLQAAIVLASGWLCAQARADDAAERRTDAARSSHFPFGRVVPTRPIPAWPVVTDDGVQTDLAALLRNRVTALQLMFTGCKSTCPIQGALFAQAQRELGRESGTQFISISIAPLADTPAALAGWLREFEREPGWLAVRPRVQDVEDIFQLLGEGGEVRPKNSPDPHTGQVYIANRQGELVFRTPSLPPAGAIVSIMQKVSALPG